MNKFYIQDSTVGKYVYFNTVNELVNYLDKMVPRAHKISRNQYMQNLIDLGHGYDDRAGVTLTRAMQEQFNLGVVTKEGKHVRTDVHTATNFLNKEYGD